MYNTSGLCLRLRLKTHTLQTPPSCGHFSSPSLFLRRFFLDLDTHYVWVASEAVSPFETLFLTGVSHVVVWFYRSKDVGTERVIWSVPGGVFPVLFRSESQIRLRLPRLLTFDRRLDL